MAEVKVMGNVMQLTAELTNEQFEKVYAVTPDALTLIDKEGNELFKVSVGKEGAIDKNGIVFEGAKKDDKLTLSIKLPVNPDSGRAIAYIKKHFIQPIHDLHVVEKNCQDCVTRIDDMTEAVLANIVDADADADASEETEEA